MTSPTPVSPEHVPTWATSRGVVESAVSNTEALWRALAAARSHRVIDEPAWLVVDAGNDIGGTRVILRGPVTGAVQRTSLNRLVESFHRPVVVEDSFATVDLNAQGLVRGSLSVMGAGPLSLDDVPTEERPDITVRHVEGLEGPLLEAERIVVEGFPLYAYRHYQPGRWLPAGLQQMPRISVFAAGFRGAPGGACMTVTGTREEGSSHREAGWPARRRARLPGCNRTRGATARRPSRC